MGALDAAVRRNSKLSCGNPLLWTANGPEFSAWASGSTGNNRAAAVDLPRISKRLLGVRQVVVTALRPNLEANECKT